MRSLNGKHFLNAGLGLVTSSAFVVFLGIGSAFALAPPISSPLPQGVARMPSSHALMLAQAEQGAESNGVEEEKNGVEEEHQGIEEEQHGIEEEQRGIEEEQKGMEEEERGLQEEEKGMQEEQK